MLLPRKGHPSIAVAVVFIATVLLQISCGVESAEDELCDLHAWYTQAEADGAFDEPEPEVAAIEAEVKATIKAEGDKAEVKCSVIAGYDEVVYGLEEEEGEAEGREGEDEGEDDEVDGLLDDDEGAAASEAIPEKEAVLKKTAETLEVETQKATDTPEPTEEKDTPESMAENAAEASDAKDEKEKDSDDVDVLLKEILEVRENEAIEAPEPPSEQEKDIPTEKVEEELELSKPETEGGAEPIAPGVEAGKEEKPVVESGEPDGKTQTKPKTSKDEGGPEEDTEKAAPVPLASTPPVDSNIPQSSVFNQKLLAERLLAEQLRADYSGKMKDLENQLLKMENKLLVDTADKHNNSNTFTKLENQLLKLENELLRINVSFTILQAQNAQLKATFGVEAKGQYPALADKNATMVSSLVDTHQSRITELSDVITKQSDLIKALDKKAGLLEERNSDLKETLVDQSDVIKNIIKRIEDMHETQTKQKTDQDKETKRLYDVIASVEDSRKDFEPKETDSGSRNLSVPNPVGGPVDPKDEGSEVKSSDIELPEGSDGKEGSDGEEKKDKVEEAIQKQPESPKPEGHIDSETLTHAKEKYTKKGPSTPIETVQGTEDKPPSETAETGSCSKPPKEKSTVKKTKKPKGVKGTKKKKVVKKTKGGKKKVVKKKRAKVVKKEAAVAIPPPKYVDNSYHGLKDCYDHLIQGRKRDSPQRIKPVGLLRDSDVFCDMRNGGWTVIMRRQDGSMDFYRNWAEYQRGFGGTYGDHWIGLELIHRLTNQGDYQLRVDLTDWNRNSVYAVYDLFRVEGEDQGYRMHISDYSGTAGDGFAGHSGMQFSTFDKDNDLAVTDFGGSCATRFHGAWWYNKCYKANPTGKYYRGGKTAEGKYDGLAWKPWTGSDVSLKRIEMKIRPKK